MPTALPILPVFGQITDKLQGLYEDFMGEKDTTAPRKEAGEGNGASPDQQLSSHLFRCPTRETTSIAYTKEACGTCGTDVRRSADGY